VFYCVQSVQLGTLTSGQFIDGSVENWKVKKKAFQYQLGALDSQNIP
jgi:hypothetical protein